MFDLRKQEVWFLTGSQHLYGERTLRTGGEDARKIAGALDAGLPGPACRPTPRRAASG